jgi:hypothetical protein
VLLLHTYTTNEYDGKKMPKSMTNVDISRRLSNKDYQTFNRKLEDER